MFVKYQGVFLALTTVFSLSTLVIATEGLNHKAVVQPVVVQSTFTTPTASPVVSPTPVPDVHVSIDTVLGSSESGKKMKVKATPEATPSL